MTTIQVQPLTTDVMKAAQRWVVLTAKNEPFYPSGIPLLAGADSAADRSLLGSYVDACKAIEESNDRFVRLGFALGEDESGRCWQVLIITCTATYYCERIPEWLIGYVETDDGFSDIHVFGYGRDFPALEFNGSHHEAYSADKVIEIMGNPLHNGPLICLADFTERFMVPRHAGGRRFGQP